MRRPPEGGEGRACPPTGDLTHAIAVAPAASARSWAKSTDWASLAAAARSTPAEPPPGLLRAPPCRWRGLRRSQPQVRCSEEDWPSRDAQLGLAAPVRRAELQFDHSRGDDRPHGYYLVCYRYGRRWRSGGASIPTAQIDRESGLSRQLGGWVCCSRRGLLFRLRSLATRRQRACLHLQAEVAAST